ncbi:hypothetical protein BT63DRAFT_431397 [Microthyrium microscopicum]|uniref:Glucosamine-6-phosphate isomerase n=1 Tax=Microthyrium microscopicum TaxID=703497 RepID=A0A6A6UMP8_9PEZI|nr:hypothetical protein BT63DRAFT_431397 [Microthyrium microscopicum]
MASYCLPLGEGACWMLTTTRRLVVRDNQATASEYVAEYIIQRINAFAPTATRPFVLGLPTGSSPQQVYAILVAAFREKRISFKHVITFNMDEYVGLPSAHPQSYHTFMYNHLFSHIDIDPSNVHILDGNAPDLESECAAYEAAIRKAGGIELFLGGIGPDGHVAFNEPGSSLNSRTRVKTLAYDTILANSRFFGDDLGKVPRMALTVGVATVLAAKEVVIIITGAHKALALQKCIEGPVNHMWTLSSLQMHQHALIVVDEDATLELQVKTVKYFKSIEGVAKECGYDQMVPSEIARQNAERAAEEAEMKALLESKGNGTKANGANGGLMVNGTPQRAVTPDIIPDRMSSRISDPPIPEGMMKENGELKMSNMHSRMPVPAY